MLFKQWLEKVNFVFRILTIKYNSINIVLID